MPEHYVHDSMCNTVSDCAFKSVDRTLDWWVRYMGRNHRKVFHDGLTAPIMGIIASRSLLGAVATGLHILIDDACSKNKDLEQLLQIPAKNASRRRHWQIHLHTRRTSACTLI